MEPEQVARIASYCEQVARDGIVPSLAWFAETAVTLRSALLAVAVSPQDWQPISTAPKDGTHIFLTQNLYRAVGRWGQLRHFKEGDPCQWVDLNGFSADGATHWQPLPPPIGDTTLALEITPVAAVSPSEEGK